MEIWLDTANIDLIKTARQFGILKGITTNPSILANAKKDVEHVLQEILSVQSGPVTAQVTAEDFEGMLRQADQFQSYSKRIIIKVPVTIEGLKAIHQLARQNSPTMATAVFHPNQALLAAMAGATYVAPYLSKMQALNGDAFDLLQSMVRIFMNYGLETKIIAASIKNAEEFRQCAEIGAHAITLNDQVFNTLIENHDMTMQSVEKFATDWKKAKTAIV